MAELVFIGVRPPYENFPHSDKHILDVERLVLLNNMEKLGIPIVPVDVSWPRDYFVFHKNKLYEKKKHGFYADGGYVLARQDFTMVCSEVSRDWDKNEIDTIETRTSKLLAMYGNDVSVFSAPDPDMDPAVCPHIDLVMLPIAERKVIFVDSKYFSRHKVTLQQFASRHSLSIRQVGDNYNKRSWPCNSLIYRNGRDTYAFVEKDVPGDFKHELNELDITVIKVPFINNCSTGGSIHCATNTVPVEFYKRYHSIMSAFDIQK